MPLKLPKVTKKDIFNWLKETLLFFLIIPALVAGLLITSQLISYTKVTNALLNMNFLGSASAAEKIVALAFMIGGLASPACAAIKTAVKNRRERNNTIVPLMDELEKVDKGDESSTAQILKNTALGVTNAYNWGQFTNEIVTLVLIKILIENNPNISEAEINQATEVIKTVPVLCAVMVSFIGHIYGYNFTKSANTNLKEKIKDPFAEPIALSTAAIADCKAKCTDSSNRHPYMSM